MHYIPRIIFYICLAFFAIPNLYGQKATLSNSYIDSLKQQINFVSDSAKVDLLNKIAYNYYYFTHDSTDHYAELAIELAASLDYKKGLAEAQRMMGIAFKANNKDRKSIEWLYKALETARSINYHQGIADILNSIGISYNSIEDYDRALPFFKKSVEHQIIAKNRLREGIIYCNIGLLFIKKNELDSSLFYLKKSEDIIQSVGDEKWLAMVYSQFGGLWIKRNELELAEDYSKKAEKLSIRTGQTIHLRKSYQNFAEIYLERKQYNIAQKMADKALRLSDEIGYIPYLIEAYRVEYQIYVQLRQYKSALKYHENLLDYRDSLRLEQMQSEAELLNYQFELQQKENENQILRNEKENQEAQNTANKAIIQRQTIIGITIIIILVMVSVLAFIFFRLKQKEHSTNTKLSESNKRLEEQKEELSATLQMVEHLNAHLQAQNNTLNKIAIVSITDLDGNIISVNEKFCEVVGFKRDELLGSNHNILNSGEHSNEVFKVLWHTISNGNTWRGELKNKKKNGEFFWGDTAIAPIFDDEGNPKQFFSLQFDITERKKYLDELTTKSRELEDLNSLKDKLLSIISHDFRSPLNSLRGTLNLFLKGSISDEDLNILVGKLVEKLDITYNLLENLLNWAKSQMQGTKVYAKEINLKTISDDCFSLLSPIAEKKQVKIQNNIQFPINAYADNEMVKLVIRNLIANAIKFTSAGNEIIIDAVGDEDFVTVSVKDNGMGISLENKDKLFKLENFSTRGTSNEKGMGIGLLLCRDFVDKNGGKMWFESELEKGSTFYFTLPVKETIGQYNLF